MITTPLKARKSSSSWTSRPGQGLEPSLREIQRSARGERRRYVFSVGLFAVTIIGLAFGSVGGVIEDAAARDNYNRGYWNRTYDQRQRDQGRYNESERRNEPTTTTRNTQESSPPATPAPTQTRTTEPANTQPQPAPTTVAPATPVQYAAPQAVTPAPAAEPVAPADTSEAIVAMTEGQAAAVSSTPVSYATQQISTEMRNRLLALAVSALTSGALIFAMSLFGASGVSPTPPQYRKAVREVVTY